ncbi:hypothetical protein D6833_11585 [Candidatus Parcubacteria bacterium]|nr:MAG: hypothetical protein D6833_11585 [Candidatus Parcubacteria bacterium]
MVGAKKVECQGSTAERGRLGASVSALFPLRKRDDAGVMSVRLSFENKHLLMTPLFNGAVQKH